MAMRKTWLLVLLLICGLSLVTVIVPIARGIFAFTFDQGRDLIWVKNQVDFRRPSLLGPWGSLAGVYFGPLWFWLLTIPYVASQGSPVAITIFNAFVVYASILVGGLILKKHSRRVAYFFVLLAFSSPAIHGIAIYAFSQHLLPLLTFLLLYSYSQILQSSSRRHFVLSCLWISLMYHAEPPTAIFSVPSLVVISWIAAKRRKFFDFWTVVAGALVFIVPFLPQIFFEVRHEFLQIKSVLAYFTGENRSLGEDLPLLNRFLDRPQRFFYVFTQSVFQKYQLISFGVLLTTLYINFRKNKLGSLQSFWRASLIYIVSLMLVYIIYPPQLKLFYLDGLILIFVFWVAAALNYLWSKGPYRKFLVLFLLLAFFVNLNPLSFISSLSVKFEDQRQGGSVLANQELALDWVYQKAGGKGFRVYTYVSPIYDYNYQYLFLWYGLDRYGYLPAEFSYLPNKPEYVQKKEAQLQRFQDKIKLAGTEVYLIIEKEGYRDRRLAWYQQFPYSEYMLLDREELPGDILVEKRRYREL